MTLTQAISVVMGANIGTTATGWILTLASMDSHSALGSLRSTSFIFVDEFGKKYERKLKSAGAGTVQTSEPLQAEG